jgi:predicted methyltransferase
MMRHSWTPAAVLLVLSLAAPALHAAASSDLISAAVADGNRPESDKQRDANRKPAQTLEFAGIRSGEKIGELLPGGGYFTRLFSKAVGAQGHVFALVPERPPGAPADLPDRAAKVRDIAADANYSNVSVVVASLVSLAAPEPVDLVFTAQNYHDLHNVPGVDILAFNRMVFNSLRPGGTYIVLDHAAEAGSGARDTSTLHRIDADTVKKEVLSAGFELVGASDLLANPADPHTAKVFDPSIRGNTDQFLLKFRKPKK